MRPNHFTLESTDAGHVRAVAEAMRALVEQPVEVSATVAGILADVRERGDEAVLELTRRFDGEVASLRVPPAALDEALAALDPQVRLGLDTAIANIRRVAEVEATDDAAVELPEGHTVTLRSLPVSRAGVYVPGGRAAYPSSVVMNVVPAQVAGVERIVVTTPPRTLAENPAVAAALLELNVTEVYAVGGAQAIAALAFGTETVPRVDKITGPGNKYVAAAKKLVFGVVGIDAIAGPTEVVIVADDTARAEQTLRPAAIG